METKNKINWSKVGDYFKKFGWRIAFLPLLVIFSLIILPLVCILGILAWVFAGKSVDGLIGIADDWFEKEVWDKAFPPRY